MPHQQGPSRSRTALIVHVLTVEHGKITRFDAFVEDGPIMAAINGTAVGT